MKDINMYYSDELNDDFSGISRKQIEIDENFNFIHNNVLWIFCSFLIERFVLIFIAYFYRKIKFRQKVIGKKKLKGYKGKYFIYGNHTQAPGDGFLPPAFMYPRKPFFVVSPDNIAMKGTANFIMMLGAIPTPTTLKAYRSFEKSLNTYINRHHPIVIYPEAHIWPYYTKIRNFKSTSFRYPVKFNVPSFCFTNTYIKRRFSKKPKMITYIDGPFYPNDKLIFKEQVKDLRNQVYNKMIDRSKQSNYEYVYHYIKKES